MMIRAYAAGVVVLLITHGAWLVSIQSALYSTALLLVLWVSPVVASALVAYLAPQNKILLGTSIAVPAVLFATAINFIYQVSGHEVDFPGFRGSVILALIMLAADDVLSAIGAALGYFLSRKSR